jgi:hypothetical protein
MSQVAFEPTIPVLQQAKTFHALDRAATVIGADISRTTQNNYFWQILVIEEGVSDYKENIM